MPLSCFAAFLPVGHFHWGKGPQKFLGIFFYFHLKLWKVLTQPQHPAKNFSKRSRSQKKNLSFIESNTDDQMIRRSIGEQIPHKISFRSAHIMHHPPTFRSPHHLSLNILHRNFTRKIRNVKLIITTLTIIIPSHS